MNTFQQKLHRPQRVGPVDGICSFWELSQSLVAHLCEHLGLPGNPPAAVEAAREKQVFLF